MATREAFDTAVAESKQLSSRPDNNTLLLLYSLYKQATDGDVIGDEPGMFDFVAKAKYNAWQKLKGTSAEDAMQQYIDIVAQLKK
jgi:diazepam-binding inhibitor (GABA receptor modulating acyl-CoA-binding protein)